MFQRNDWITGIISLFIGVFTLIRAATWNAQSLDPSGPGAIPIILAWGIIVIGIIHLIGSWSAVKKGESKETFNWGEYKIIAQITVMCIIYILLLRSIGYLILTPLLIMGIMKSVNEPNTWKSFKVGVLSTVVLFVVFFYGLHVKLPLGFFNNIF
ncbi:MAG: tripartite tricarboxylate transporter TctB family protein [Peptococcaceae bacterium]